MSVRCPHGILLEDPTKSPKSEVIQVKNQCLVRGVHVWERM